MVDRHRNSFSQIEGSHAYQRWNIGQKNNEQEQTLHEYLNQDKDSVRASLFLAPINASNIYARRHSAHACTASEDRRLTISTIPPPIPVRPPPVPKRTIPPRQATVPGSASQKTPSPNLNVGLAKCKKSAKPPPLPPTPKSRAPPFNQLLPSQKPGLPTTSEQPYESCQNPNENRNIHHNNKTNFDFDNIKKNGGIQIKQDNNNKPPTPSRKTKPSQQTRTMRQDSGISTDSFSQNSSPSYTTKSMETPLIPPKPSTKSQNGKIINKSKDINSLKSPIEENNGLTKSVSTPVGLQAVVRFHNESTMSVHHKILKESRRPSESYNNRFFLRFRFIQLIVNALALIAIGAGMTVYFKAFPTNTVTIVNKTINVTALPVIIEKKSDNPAPGICLPVIVKFCKQHKLPYNYTIYPNYVGHFGQRDAQIDLEIYDAIVDVRCYELAALFLCTIFVPKCGPNGVLVRPCRGMCLETKRRCGFFLDVFGLTLPKYLECDLFPESPDPNVCIGQAEVKAVKIRESKPICPHGFQCDIKRCIPMDWHCDGHVDCKDQSDELNCKKCESDMIHCGFDKCINQGHMCDGKVDCPWGQDERNCLRLSDENGDEGKGILEVFRPDQKKWAPACVTQWDDHLSKNVCFLLGYKNSNVSTLINNSVDIIGAEARYHVKEDLRPREFNLIREFASCNGTNYQTVHLHCTEYICGKARKRYAERRRVPRIVGGFASKPGDWPFLAALLGGPEEVFYCAGVLIADQWVLTASHCVGNHSDVNGWTIQLGITRRHAHSFYGQKMKVKRVVPHPHYNQGFAHDNDVALFQLAHRVTYHEHLLPVCLPKPTQTLEPGTICTVIGWGKREDTGEYEPEINEVEVPVLDRNLCNVWLEHRELNVTDGMICAGYKEGGKDACQGDSGGPLLCREHKNSDSWFVGGIVSWGIKCAHPHLPGVYAYVPKYIDWIHSQVEKYSELND
ncbi:atrial natriuretic peptide-converting enzyme isoform X2 [Anthonomus grandis grandis]|uniref:atrial natriuretic peptide-converting enzyme isoform X2 n=1 Tax=Anthonomus grandis grandis TaxID=2921223 RepID=UPI0021652166|nr:atrial natriuretic peptide-converting enzyme isoform X2 [Anthonomus grandis grandis]